MTKPYLNELVTDGAKQWQRQDLEGTKEERLAYDTSGLHENDSWFETDTFKVYFWNVGLNDWITKGGSNG